VNTTGFFVASLFRIKCPWSGTASRTDVAFCLMPGACCEQGAMFILSTSKSPADKMSTSKLPTQYCKHNILTYPSVILSIFW
jgi:hypothetical protein